VLHAADGTLIAVADTHEATLAGAAKFNLEALRLHQQESRAPAWHWTKAS